MHRGLRIGLIAVGIVVAIVLVVLSAPVTKKNMDECHAKGGMYIAKSMQCITKDGIENMLWK